MNITYLIGNGFDINLGIKSRYENFYNDYQSIHSKNELINRLKSTIAEDYQKWADFERELGKYTEEIPKSEDFIKVLSDILVNLSEYMQKQENNFDINSVDSDEFLHQLGNPHLFFPIADSNEIKNFILDSNGKSNLNVNIISFNYTKIIEKILGDKSVNIPLNKNDRPDTVANKIKRIYHVHGVCEDSPILGVNSIDQIKNKSYHSNINLINCFVKREYNKISKTNIHTNVEGVLKNSKVICVFGSSFGETDKIWWEFIGQRLLKSDAILLIYEHGQPVNPILGFGVEEKRIMAKLKFLTQTNLNEADRDKVSEKIYVAYNSNMFSIKKENILSK